MKLRFSSAHVACVAGLAHALVLAPVACGDSASSDGSSSSTGQACKEELEGCSLNEECCSGGWGGSGG
jgi:hypothetical protein